MTLHLPIDLPRRLLSVDPRRVPGYRFDVVVVGSGAAGGACAVAAAQSGAEVAVLAKADLCESNTVYAQGGVAAVFDPSDSFEQHIADTLDVGCGLSERSVAEFVVRSGPQAMERVMGWGAAFDRDADGRLDLSREGGHSHPRILHARGDQTGREIQEAARRAVESNPRITAFARTFVVDLMTDDSGRVVSRG